MSIDPLEWIWIAINSTAVFVTLYCLVEAYRDRKVTIPQTPQGIVARGNILRQLIRLVIQLLLLSLVLPGIFVDQRIPLDLFVISLILVSFFVLLNSVLDTFIRRALHKFFAEEARQSLPSKPTVLAEGE